MTRQLAAAVFVTWLSTASAFAQAGQPVYPAYDGFIRNADGSFTLAFGYFSHNSDEVTIPPGPNNQFAPQPADRQQPIRFLPGQHRFQCIMVVDSTFDGKLRWTLGYAGVTTASSEKMLQYSWELEDASARDAMRGVDLETAPRGVCLNRPPVVRVLGLTVGRGAKPLTVSVGEALRLFGSVEDEGLPRDGKLTIGWKKIGGPGTVTFSEAAAARTRATFSAPGSYQLELTASDSQRDSRIQVAVTVR